MIVTVKSSDEDVVRFKDLSPYEMYTDRAQILCLKLDSNSGLAVDHRTSYYQHPNTIVRRVKELVATV